MIKVHSWSNMCCHVGKMFAGVGRKEARKNKLRETASGIKTTGKDQQVFRTSDYMVSEEARTPNVHSRQVSAEVEECSQRIRCRVNPMMHLGAADWLIDCKR
jgi:hypothetical protein